MAFWRGRSWEFHFLRVFSCCQNERQCFCTQDGDGETYQNQNHMDSGNIWQILGAVVDSLGDIGGICGALPKLLQKIGIGYRKSTTSPDVEAFFVCGCYMLLPSLFCMVFLAGDVGSFCCDSWYSCVSLPPPKKKLKTKQNKTMSRAQFIHHRLFAKLGPKQIASI